jgi:2-hydroxychromene-2-carboxylate isomerase
MSAKVEFFYDYVSIYSYLADSQLGNLADAEIVYRPMFLGAVMEATGNRPPGTVDAKRSYMMADVARWTERYSLPFKMNPLFPQNTLKALRLALVAQKHGVFETVHRELFDATNEAVERGAFGAPTFFVGEQMFFGNDRFEFIEEAIRNRG